MTLRQWYAGQAIGDIVCLSNATCGDIDGACERAAALAFKVADAMIREGNREPDIGRGFSGGPAIGRDAPKR